jgi:hypothetical protein
VLFHCVVITSVSASEHTALKASNQHLSLSRSRSLTDLARPARACPCPAPGDISKWSPNSAIVHAVSVTGPTGPYARKDVAVPPFAHNPKVVQAPDGTWLMYTIGVPVDASKLANCSTDTVTGAKLLQRAEAGKSNAAPSPPGRTPGNLESNVTLFTARSIAGPWTRFGVVLGPDWEGTWDEDTSNPSPLVLPNGTVLLMYRGCVVGGGGCHSEYIGIASASNWRGPYAPPPPSLSTSRCSPCSLQSASATSYTRSTRHHYLFTGIFRRLSGLSGTHGWDRNRSFPTLVLKIRHSGSTVGATSTS